MIELIFWLTLLLFFYSYFLYPIFVFVLSVIVNNKILKKDIEPHVSMIITAYNEEKTIVKKIKNSLSLIYPSDKLEIIVASDGSTDRTDSLVRDFKDPRVKLLRVEGRVGKTETQNIASSKARGEILLFSDAASMYQQDAIQKLIRNFHDPKVGGVGGHCKYIVPSGAEKTGFATKVFWWLESLIKKSQTRLWTITGTSGLIYAVRKSLYAPLPPNIISDMVEPLMIAKQNYRFVYEPEAIALEETTTKFSQEYKMRVRVISRGMVGMIFSRALLNPVKYPWIAFQLISHKITRWLLPFYLVTLFFLNSALVNKGLTYQWLLAGQSIVYFTALASTFYKAKNDTLRNLQNILLYFLTLASASFIALLKVLSRGAPTTWNPERNKPESRS